MRGVSRLLLAAFALTLPLLGVGARISPLSGQVPDSLLVPPQPQDTVSDTTVVLRRITPRGAFIRSSLIPGWGHMKAGAPVRGGFYFALQSTTAFMLFKTQAGLKDVRGRLELAERIVTSRQAGAGTTDPAAVEAALAEDPAVEDLRALEVTRSEQREDWIALGIFIIFLGGADAYVSAHLADFPVAVEVEPTPSGGMEVGFSIPFRF